MREHQGHTVANEDAEERSRARRILGPLQRVFEPVLGDGDVQLWLAADVITSAAWSTRALNASIFSDFPPIMFNVSEAHWRADDRWDGLLDEFQLAFVQRRVTMARDDVPGGLLFSSVPIPRRAKGKSRRRGGGDRIRRAESRRVGTIVH
jgi:hypothetical protein